MWLKKKPSELVRLFAHHPNYNPEGLVADGAKSYYGTRYLCCVPEQWKSTEEPPPYEDLRLFRQKVEDKLRSLDATVLHNHFRYNLRIPQTLENSREFWEEFAKELESQGL